MADTKHRRPEQDTVVQGNFRVPKLSECVEKHLDDMGILEKNKVGKPEVQEISSSIEQNELTLTSTARDKEAEICKRPPKPTKGDIAGLQELNSFTKTVNQTMQSYQAEQSQPVVKVEQLLSSLRKRFDDVHAEVKKRTEEVARYKEGIRQADSAEHQVTNDRARIHQRAEELTQSLSSLNKKVAEAGYTKKVYMHILERTKLEKDAVRQKNLMLQSRLKSLGLELKEERGALEKQQKKKIRAVSELKQLEQELQGERIIRNQGLKEIDEAIEYKRAAIEKRQRLVEWQQSVVNDAAAAALSASSGKWRRMLCVEKLIANSLQKTSVENVEKWQYKEDTFQKIREATGMADVMEIVNKFLNRDVENQKLKRLAEEAEKKLEKSRREYQEAVRRAVEELDLTNCTHIRNLYDALDAQSQSWNKTFHDHAARYKLLKRCLGDVDQARRCAASINARLVKLGIEDLWDFSAESSLEHYFQNLREKSIPKLIGFHDSIRNIRNCIGRDDNMEAHDRCALIIQPPANDTECHQEGMV